MRTLEASAQEASQSGYISFQDYLRLYDGRHAEWHTGEGVVLGSASVTHQRLLKFLLKLLDAYFDLRPIGLTLFAPFSMYISDDQPAREPDILVVLNEHRERILATYLDGAADIVIEIVSPESVVRDYGDKFSEYEKAGVREYWLFDPMRQQADIHSLQADGLFHRAPLDTHGRLASAVLPGFALDPQLLWRDPLPSGSELLGLVQYMIA